MLAVTWVACTPTERGAGNQNSGGFKFLTEQFADLKLIRYQIPGFENLSPRQKELLYYLSEAALSGRDIVWRRMGSVYGLHQAGVVFKWNSSPLFYLEVFTGFFDRLFCIPFKKIGCLSASIGGRPEGGRFDCFFNSDFI